MKIPVHLVTLESVLSAEVWTWNSRQKRKPQHLPGSSKQLYRKRLSHLRLKNQAALGAESANTPPYRCSSLVTQLELAQKVYVALVALGAVRLLVLKSLSSLAVKKLLPQGRHGES